MPVNRETAVGGAAARAKHAVTRSNTRHTASSTGGGPTQCGVSSERGGRSKSYLWMERTIQYVVSMTSSWTLTELNYDL